MVRRDLGHLPSGRDQTVNHSLMEGTLSDRVDVGIGGLQTAVDLDAAALTQFQTVLLRKLVARAESPRRR